MKPKSERRVAGVQTIRFKPMKRRNLPVDTVAMARYLIGKILVRDLPDGRMSGRIVETEAYPVGDSTGYAFPGRTCSNAPLFLARGHAYVRLVYGSAYTLNLSSEAAGTGAAVLLRAVEPLAGVDRMRRRRRGVRLVDIARGPGRLAQAMGIDTRFDGADLCSGTGLWLGTVTGGKTAIGRTRRIGLSREQHRRLRFYERGSPFVSGPRKLLARQSSPKRR
jgi:DNA-3-methyladenine glycosylase